VLWIMGLFDTADCSHAWVCSMISFPWLRLRLDKPIIYVVEMSSDRVIDVNAGFMISVVN